MRQVLLWFRGEQISLPAIAYNEFGRTTLGRLPTYGTICGMIGNPCALGTTAHGLPAYDPKEKDPSVLTLGDSGTLGNICELRPKAHSARYHSCKIQIVACAPWQIPAEA